VSVAKFLLLLSLFLPFSAWAEVDLLQWQPPGYKYTFGLPQVRGESKKAALERYFIQLEKNPELKRFAPKLRAAGRGTLKPYAAPAGPAVLAIANDPDDLIAVPARIGLVVDPLTAKGAQAVLAPVAVTAGLSEANADIFRKKISDNFDGLLALGGDDIHPSLYDDADPQGLAVHTNLSRDQEELKLVRSYLEEGKGFFSGICRGHQMGGVAASCSLVKDIREELKLDHSRRVDHSIRREIANPGHFTSEIFDGNSSISVNSLHHQAVRAPTQPNPRIKVTAVAEGQPAIAEIAEYYGRRGLSVQMHPELMGGSAFHARFYDVLFGEVDRAHGRRTNRPLRYIDLDKTLFGIEYTFQDQNMVDEPGRMTMETPHKRARFKSFRSAYMRELGAKRANVGKFGEAGFKPGSTIKVPRDGKHVMSMEPVTIEVNTPPKKFHEIESAAEPIFRAAERAELQAYINPGAERSGMGHIHIGGRTLGDSPFYKNPHLLRNMMVYQHKHPSVLWGFAEAYDIDNFDVPTNNDVTNIETYHKPKQQAAFERAVKNFDNWYEKTRAAGRDLSDGLRQYLRFLRAEEGPDVDFFDNYRFINLEHLTFIADSPVPVDPKTSGKATVEFRNFRPPRTPQHAKAHAEFLLAMMERQAPPQHLEKFEVISPDAYNRFHSATRAAADWEIVKRELPRYNPIWDDSVGEYVRIQHGVEAVKAKLSGAIRGEIFPAFSPKSRKGTKFELRLPVETHEAPKVAFAGRPMEFDRVQVGGKEYWVTVFDADGKTGLAPVDVAKMGKAATCSQWFQVVK